MTDSFFPKRFNRRVHPADYAKKHFYIFFMFFLLSLAGALSLRGQRSVQSQTVTQYEIPLGGNGFINQGTENGARITDNGLVHWSDQKTVTKVYFRISKAGHYQLALKIIPDGNSTLSITVSGKNHIITVPSSGNKDSIVIQLGMLSIRKSGYVHADIQGIKKSGKTFGNLRALILDTDQKDVNINYVAAARDFHFGRRGPSVHWNFLIPASMKKKVQYFYNEIYVPKGQDIVGSYFEANGFSFGYFGMQVNSKTERRILFSVWSPFSTDHPEEIPEEKRIHLIKKGVGVHGGEFGGEGSGGQSYLTYNWTADAHYSFLLKASPDSTAETTTFTAYFKKTTDPDWKLIAAFKRPETVASLEQLYSFLENFQPSMGNITRRGYYTNQWLRGFDGQWAPVESAKFTTDATGNAGQRLDFRGGVDNKGFFLENCGFFDPQQPAQVGQLFKPLKLSTQPPKIDFSKLP